MFRKIFLFLLVALCPTAVFAYSHKTTHPALTSQIIELYESNGKVLSAEQKQALLDGSSLEDTTPRYINHFYDPINNTAWTGSKTGNVSSETTRLLTKLGLSSEDPLKATEWITNQNLQLSYSPYEGDRTWNRALNYYANKNTLEAYKTLGFILHVLEDMSVPEHTRDDTHAQSLEFATADSGSPYEDFTSQYNASNIGSLNLIGEIKNSAMQIPKFSFPEEYLKSMAQYSNKYFFSKDTINDSKYSDPKIIREDNIFAIGKDENSKEFPIAAFLLKKNLDQKQYIIEDLDGFKPILDAYFNRLAKQAIIHGVGLMQLFDKQAEDALVNKDFPQHLVALDRDKLDSIMNPPTFSFAGLISKFYGTAAGALGTAINAGRAIQDGAYQAGQTVGEFITKLFRTNNLVTDDDLTEELMTSDRLITDNKKVTYQDGNQLGDPVSARVEGYDLFMEEDLYSSAKLIPTTTAVLPLTATSSTTTTTPVVENLQPMPAPPTPARISSGGGGSVTVITPAKEPEPPVSSEHVLISEILFNASSTDEGKEFIELYNPLSTPQALGGWSLKYSKDSATTTTSLASFKASSTEDNVTIPAKGFLLVGLYNYDPVNYSGKTADITRSAQLPNGGTSSAAQKITIYLYDSDKKLIDSIYYDKDSIADEGQSLEREVKLADGTCLAANNEYEFSGHGCDAAERSSLVVREIPKPQNSLSMPEPRNKPTAPPFVEGKTSIAEVDKSGLKIHFSWSESKDYSGNTSTIKYVLTVGTSTVLETFSTGTEISISETGSGYGHKLVAEDADGLRSDIIDASSFFPDLPDNVYFYKDPRDSSPTSTKYFVDIRYSSRPFIRSGGISWQALVGYLNRNPNGANGSLNTANDFKVTDGDGVLFTYVFAVDPTKCDGVGGGLDNTAACLPEEDGRLTFNPEILATTTADLDYVRLAYYELTHSGGGSQELSRIATGPRIYLLGGLLAQQLPTTPANFNASFDDLNSLVSLSWEKSTDIDSADSEITYEVQLSTSTEFSTSSWTNIGKTLNYVSTVEYPNDYLIGVRARDDFNNYSEPTSKTFRFPTGYEKPILSGRIDSGAAQPFTVLTDGLLGSIHVYTADFETASRDPSSNPCTLTLYEQVGGVNTQIAIPDNSFNGASCTGEKIFTFGTSTSTQLYASSTYLWAFSYSGVPTDPPKLKFYGKTSVLPAGPFSNPSLGSAKFKVKDVGGNIIAEN
jgi:hypothetical protein